MKSQLALDAEDVTFLANVTAMIAQTRGELVPIEQKAHSLIEAIETSNALAQTWASILPQPLRADQKEEKVSQQPKRGGGAGVKGMR